MDLTITCTERKVATVTEQSVLTASPRVYHYAAPMMPCVAAAKPRRLPRHVLDDHSAFSQRSLAGASADGFLHTRQVHSAWTQ
jgi:hypothetical protein